MLEAATYDMINYYYYDSNMVVIWLYMTIIWLTYDYIYDYIKLNTNMYEYNMFSNE